MMTRFFSLLCCLVLAVLVVLAVSRHRPPPTEDAPVPAAEIRKSDEVVGLPRRSSTDEQRVLGYLRQTLEQPDLTPELRTRVQRLIHILEK